MGFLFSLRLKCVSLWGLLFSHVFTYRVMNRLIGCKYTNNPTSCVGAKFKNMTVKTPIHLQLLLVSTTVESRHVRRPNFSMLDLKVATGSLRFHLPLKSLICTCIVVAVSFSRLPHTTDTQGNHFAMIGLVPVPSFISSSLLS